MYLLRSLALFCAVMSTLMLPFDAISFAWFVSKAGARIFSILLQDELAQSVGINE